MPGRAVLLIIVATLLIGVVPARVAGQSTGQQVLTVVGSTTIQPVMEEVSDEYRDAFGIGLGVFGGGSGAGIEALRSGVARIATVSRSLTPAERDAFSARTIGYDALAIIVNEENPRERITTAELCDIYTGRVRTWDDAPYCATRIIPVSKQIGRGTLAVFEEYTDLLAPGRRAAGTGQQKRIRADAWEAGSNLDAILWVGGLPGAIAYVSVGAADRFIAMGLPVRKLVLDGAAAEVQTIESGRYPVVRELNLVYRTGDDAATDLVRYMGSPAGQRALRELGYIPAASSPEGEPR
jgi:phosphate transport system substrate-binding protein